MIYERFGSGLFSIRPDSSLPRFFFFHSSSSIAPFTIAMFTIALFVYYRAVYYRAVYYRANYRTTVAETSGYETRDRLPAAFY